MSSNAFRIAHLSPAGTGDDEAYLTLASRQAKYRHNLTGGIVKRIALLAAGCLLLAGCGGSAATITKTVTAAPTTTTAPAFTTTYGGDAAVLASHDTACITVTPSSADSAAATELGIVSVATCTLLGHPVFFETWKDALSQSNFTLGQTAESYYGSGTGWVAGDNEPSALLTAQQAIAQQVAAALGGTVTHFAPTK